MKFHLVSLVGWVSSIYRDISRRSGASFDIVSPPKDGSLAPRYYYLSSVGRQQQQQAPWQLSDASLAGCVIFACNATSAPPPLLSNLAVIWLSCPQAALTRWIDVVDDTPLSTLFPAIPIPRGASGIGRRSMDSIVTVTGVYTDFMRFYERMYRRKQCS